MKIEDKIEGLIQEGTKELDERKIVTEDMVAEDSLSPSTEDIKKVADDQAPKQGASGNPTMDGLSTEPTEDIGHIPGKLLKAASELADT